jgi:hypothetical protein
MKGVDINHRMVVDSSEAEENLHDHIVQVEETLVSFALPLLLVRDVLRRRYAPVV